VAEVPQAASARNIIIAVHNAVSFFMIYYGEHP
jgi:hypothetical protein